MERTEDNKKTFLTMLTNSATSIITIIISFFAAIIITRIISVADVGIATSFASLRNILTIVCLLAIYISINRILLDLKNKDFEYLSSIYIFSSLFCVLTFIIYYIFRNFFNTIFAFDTNMMILLFSIIFLANGATIMNSYWNYKGSYKKLMVFNILSSPVAQITSIILAYLLVSNKYLGRIIGVEIFNIIIGILCGIYILYKGKFTFNKEYIKKSLEISLPMIPHLLAQILLTSCDLLMIKAMIGNAEAGIYSMAYTVSNVFYLIMLQIFMPWSPWVYRRLKENMIKPIYNNSKILMIFTAYLALGLFSIAPEMIMLFLPQAYYPAGLIIAPICIGIFFEIMYIFFYDVEYYYKKNKQISLFSVIAAVLNIILNYICLKKFGYQAAAYTTLISYFILLILHYIGMRKLDKRNIYNIKYLILLSIFLLLIMAIYLLTNNNFVIRYTVIISVTMYLLIKYKKTIIDLLKQIRRS